jgi:4-amino-4-deoxy-L-arabinose transferase-like glycosyltransferase
MRFLRWIRESWNDLVRGPGTFSERLTRQETFVLFAILAVAAVLRLLFLIKFHDELWTRREKGFWLMGWNWVNGLGFGIAENCPSSFRAPLYILFTVPFLFFFGTDYTWPLGLAQLVVSVANVYLIYRIGKEWRSPRVGLVGAAFAAVYPYVLYHDTQYYITFLFTFFMLLAVWGWLVLERARNLQIAALTGLSLGLASLATSGPIVFFAPLASFWLWWRWRNLKAAAKAVGIAALFTVLTLSPWIFRNWKLHHAFVPLTTDAGRAAQIAYNPWALHLLTNKLHGDLTPWVDDVLRTPMQGRGQRGCGYLGMTELENTKRWQTIAWDWVRAHPGESAVLAFVKFNQLWRPWLWTPKDAVGENGAIIFSAVAMNWAYALSYAPLLILAAFEWLASSKNERRRGWLFVLLAIAFSLTYSLTYAYTKYRIPFDAILAVMAAAGVWRWIDGWREHHNKVAEPGPRGTRHAPPPK